MIMVKRGPQHADIVVKDLEAAQELFDILIQEREELLAKYTERGYAMRETGDMVRSLYMPQVKMLREIIRELWAGNILRARQLDAEFKVKWPP